MRLSSLSHHIKPAPTVALAALFVVAAFTLRDHGVYATIMWDEWEYDRYTRSLPIGAADVPYYLYYVVYGITKFCGDHFLGCAQILNATFLAAAMPFVYLVCRRTASQNVSLWVAVLSVLGGISAYATHFMPESMYFFTFWLGAWGLLSAVDSDISPIHLGIGTGTALAVLSLVKLHAIFLIPGIMVFFLACSITGLSAGGFRNFVITATLMLIAFLAVRLSLGYLFAGAAGFNIFGTVYKTRTTEAMAGTKALLNVGLHAVPFAIAHIAALVTMFTAPYLLMGGMSLHPATTPERKILTLQFFAWSLLIPLIVVTAIYTARVVMLDPVIEGANGLLRLHMRYYNVLFPLFNIIAAAEISKDSTSIKFNIARLFAAGAVSMIALFFVANLKNVALSLSDGPELRGFATMPVIACILTGLGVLAAFLWITNPRHAAMLYLLLIFPVFTFMGAGAAAISAHKEKTPNIYHRAGIFAKDRLKSDVAKMAVVAPDHFGVFQTMFYADNPDIVYYAEVPEHNCLTFSPAADGKEWILLAGDYHLRSTVDQKIVGDGYALVHTQAAKVEQKPCQAEGTAVNK